MKITIKKSLQALLIVPMLALGVSVVVPALQPSLAFAQAPVECDEGDLTLQGGANCAAGDGQAGDVVTDGSLIKTVTDTLLFIIGAVAVIMLIYGGFKYVTSGGDSSAVTSAKNTILYAVIGIIVAVLGYAIVSFVIGAFTG